MSADIQAISEWLRPLQAHLHGQYGVSEIYLAGGSARSLLDHLERGMPLQFRDLDVVAAMASPVTAGLADRLGRELERLGLGRYLEKDLRSRPRANPAAAPGERLKHNAGYGFFIKNDRAQMLDLSLFHSKQDLRLNGIFDIDRVMIRLPHDLALAEAARAPPERRDWLDDRHGGYERWKRGRLKIVNWLEVSRDPLSNGIRILRSYSQLGRGLPPRVEARLKALIGAARSHNAFQAVRNILKLLESKPSGETLAALVRLGLFRTLSPSLHERLIRQSPQQLHEALDQPENAFDRFAALLAQAPLAQRLPLVKHLAKAEPSLFARSLGSLLAPGPGESEPRIGYYTGEFGPFHRGHLGVVRSALGAGNLDVLLVLPTPHPSNQPKTPEFEREEWLERIRFAELGTEDEPRALVLPPSRSDAAAQTTLPKLIRAAEEQLPRARPLTHVMGSDSYRRVVNRGLLMTDPRPRLVVERAGIALGRLLDNSPARLIPNAHPGNISGTQILHELAATGSSPDLSSPVREFLLSLPRYQAIVEGLKSRLDSLGDSEAGSFPAPRGLGGEVVVLDPRLYVNETWYKSPPRADGAYRSLLERILSESPSRVFVYLPRGKTAEAVRVSWSRLLASLNDPGVSLIAHFSEIEGYPLSRRVHMIHSKRANWHFQHGYLQTWTGDGLRFAVFQTPDEPLSPLLNRLAVYPLGRRIATTGRSK